MKFRLLSAVLLSASFIFSGCNLSDEGTDGTSNNRSDACDEGRAVCSDRGDCAVDGSSFTCACDTGYTGDTCDTCAPGFINASDDSDECTEGVLPSCDGVDCGNGTCMLDAQNEPICECNDGWAGDACDACEEGKIEFEADSGVCVDDLCAAAPCAAIMNATAASCAMTAADAFECGCGDGYLWSSDVEPAICEAQCEDVDEDGYGIGPACLGPDCLDSDQSVWQNDQKTIIAAGLTSGLRSAAVDRTETLSIDIDHLFTRDPACPTCSGKIMAAYYSPNTNYIPWATCAATSPRRWHAKRVVRRGQPRLRFRLPTILANTSCVSLRSAEWKPTAPQLPRPCAARR